MFFTVTVSGATIRHYLTPYKSFTPFDFNLTVGSVLNDTVV